MSRGRGVQSDTSHFRTKPRSWTPFYGWEQRRIRGMYFHISHRSHQPTYLHQEPTCKLTVLSVVIYGLIHKLITNPGTCILNYFLHNTIDCRLVLIPSVQSSQFLKFYYFISFWDRDEHRNLFWCSHYTQCTEKWPCILPLSCKEQVQYLSGGINSGWTT